MIFMSLWFMLWVLLMIVGGIVLLFVVNVKFGFFLFVIILILILFLFWVLKKGGVLFCLV